MAPMPVVYLPRFTKRDSPIKDHIRPVQNSSMTSSDVDASGQLAPLNGTLYIAPIGSILVLVLYVIVFQYLPARRRARKKIRLSALQEQREEQFLKSLPPAVLGKERSRCHELAIYNNGSNSPLNLEENETCAICLDDIEPEQMIRKLPRCQHFFHLSCCDSWICKELRRKAGIRVRVADSDPVPASFKDIRIPCPICRIVINGELQDMLPEPDSVYLRRG